VVAGSHHFDEEQDPDPHRIRICIKVKKGIRFRINVMRSATLPVAVLKAN
jgi:hypothetical protein